MRNFRILLTLLALLVCAQTAFSEEVPLEKARQIAETFFGSRPLTRASADVDLQMIWSGNPRQTKGQDVAPAFYVFDNASGPGFVIVAGEDGAKPILGYSFENEFVVENMPVNVKAWMDGLEEAVALARNNPEAYAKSAASTGNVVLKYETAKWNQSAPYNNLCPYDAGSRSVTGCVATSVAIVMRYHKWPQAGTGTIPAYVTSSKGISVSAIELGYDYDWDNMPLTYPQYGYTDAQAQAVARLMADCGAMVMMDYTADSSGAPSENIPYALDTFMGYDGSIGCYKRAYYTDDQWHAMIQKELSENGPVLYSGHNDASGHAFVLDGYTDNRYYSLNWGWGSYCDGYFTLDALNPTDQGIGGSDDGYNLAQTAILNVKKEEGGSSELRGYIYPYNGVSGLVADRTVFEPGVYFKLSTGLLVNASNTQFNGQFGFVIMDGSEQLKEVVYSFNAALPAGYGYHFTDEQMRFWSALQRGDHLIAAMYDEANSRWVKMISDKTDGSVDTIPLCDVLSVAESTSFEYNTLTKVITLKVKDGVSVAVTTAEGAAVNGAVVSSANEITITTASLAAGRYRVVLSKGSDSAELYFVVGSEE